MKPTLLVDEYAVEKWITVFEETLSLLGHSEIEQIDKIERRTQGRI